MFDTFEENGDDVLVSGTASGEINRHETIDGEENMNDSLPVDLRFKATLKKLDT
ncbi:hypothetical protein [Marinihelvus fidelis]|uniref:hypothetical protein n=1 Tax=Marinihelvus fidelis TaxID=2613842 RepID=UPI0017845A46|nr:hypothetical protein [Marinihelvus fidelis]